MSTESQDYSIAHQLAKIHEYAKSRGLTITREYVDGARSGLDIKRRQGLRQLIADVQSPIPGFHLIIVYDVSRWGRFQDIDESAYHEHTCRRAGIPVIYCAETFVDDGSPMSALWKNIKRTMAAEYSRELSEKVFLSQCRFIRMGFKQGGHAGFGLRRMAISSTGNPRRLLALGEAKCAPTDRVVLVQGPQQEVDTVLRIYRLYIEQRMSEPAIARLLNGEGCASEFARPWTHSMVNSILTNVKYCGDLLYNRRSCKLSAPRTKNAPGQWVRNVHVIEPIITPAVFEQARQERSRRLRRYTAEELIGLIKRCHAEHGRITAKVIASDTSMPDPQLLARTFGSLVASYAAAGIRGSAAQQNVARKESFAKRRRGLLDDALSLVRDTGKTAEQLDAVRFRIDGAVIVRVDVLPRRSPPRGDQYWKVKPREGVNFVIAARFDPEKDILLDHFLFRADQLAAGPLYLRQSNITKWEMARYKRLADIFGL